MDQLSSARLSKSKSLGLHFHCSDWAVSRTIKSTGDASQLDQHYSILLILTDGIINDMADTVKTVVDVSVRLVSLHLLILGFL